MLKLNNRAVQGDFGKHDEVIRPVKDFKQFQFGNVKYYPTIEGVEYFGNSTPIQGVEYFSNKNIRDSGMGDLWTDFRDQFLVPTGQAALTAAQQAALATAANQALSNPAIQQAMIEEAKKSALEKTLDQLNASAAATKDWISQNKMLVIGGSVAAGVLLVMLLRRK